MSRKFGAYRIFLTRNTKRPRFTVYLFREII